MALILVVKDGARAGDQFRPQNGLTLGRSKGDIILRDSKVSNPHAQIKEELDGSLYLVDQGSSNGIWVNDQKVDKVLLKQGLQVRLGSTTIDIAEEAEMDLPEQDRDTWRGKLWTFLKSGELQALTAQTAQPHVFQSPISLEFVGGPCLGLQWTLGYGPRKIGSASHDLHLPDQSLPGVCVEVLFTGFGPELRSLSSEPVLLNGHRLSSEKIKSGDMVQIGKHLIRIGI